MKYALIWLAMVTNPTTGQQFPAAGQHPDVFATVQECEDFGHANAKRMEDFMRGHINVPLTTPIQIDFECGPVEQ